MGTPPVLQGRLLVKSLSPVKPLIESSGPLLTLIYGELLMSLLQKQEEDLNIQFSSVHSLNRV